MTFQLTESHEEASDPGATTAKEEAIGWKHARLRKTAQNPKITPHSLHKMRNSTFNFSGSDRSTFNGRYVADDGIELVAVDEISNRGH
jgi:type IV secretory pathway VirD2 relaxase